MDRRIADDFKVVALFLSLTILLNLVAWAIAIKGGLSFVERFTADAATYLINLSGIKALATGNRIAFDNHLWLVNLECSALFVIIAFSSLVLATPSGISLKIRGLIAGVSAIIVANLLRLLVLARLTVLESSYARYFHDYIWQVAFILMVVSLWLLWLGRVNRVEYKD